MTRYGFTGYGVRDSPVYGFNSQSVPKLTQECGAKLKDAITLAKDYRELFSYRFPADAVASTPHFDKIDVDETISLCALVCEVSQLNSECLQSSVMKNVADECGVDMDLLHSCFVYKTECGIHIDDEDWYRTKG